METGRSSPPGTVWSSGDLQGGAGGDSGQNHLCSLEMNDGVQGRDCLTKACTGSFVYRTTEQETAPVCSLELLAADILTERTHWSPDRHRHGRRQRHKQPEIQLTSFYKSVYDSLMSLLS